jgi:hypothetical protein
MLKAVPRRKNPHAVALARRRMSRMTRAERQAVARLGGQASAQKNTSAERVAMARQAARARARALTPDQRKAIARAAAQARWAKAKGQRTQ